MQPKRYRVRGYGRNGDGRESLQRPFREDEQPFVWSNEGRFGWSQTWRRCPNWPTAPYQNPSKSEIIARFEFENIKKSNDFRFRTVLR